MNTTLDWTVDNQFTGFMDVYKVYLLSDKCKEWFNSQDELMEVFSPWMTNNVISCTIRDFEDCLYDALTEAGFKGNVVAND